MKKYSYEELVEIIGVLRSDKGCPWDKKQTHDSLMPYMLEESYEVIEAIKEQDMNNLREELGDVLLQVLLHAQIAKENNMFTIEDVVNDLAVKMVYRHPHVFGEDNLTKENEVLEKWEELKKKEKKQKAQYESMEGIAKSLPAIVRAQKVTKKAADVGFVWDTYQDVLCKIQEELEEVKEEVTKGDTQALELEIGDLIFSVVGLSHILQINAEFALTKCIEKFINRFRYIEKSAFAQGKVISDLTLLEMEELWQQAKQME